MNESLEYKYCCNCGNKLLISHKFCNQCGKEQDIEEKQSIKNEENTSISDNVGFTKISLKKPPEKKYNPFNSCLALISSIFFLFLGVSLIISIVGIM